jgi:hypothetical protein
MEIPPRCEVYNYTGIAMISVGAIVLGVRQQYYRNDYSNLGLGVSLIGAFGMIGGGVIFSGGQRRTGCRS